MSFKVNIQKTLLNLHTKHSRVKLLMEVPQLKCSIESSVTTIVIRGTGKLTKINPTKIKITKSTLIGRNMFLSC